MPEKNRQIFQSLESWLEKLEMDPENSGFVHIEERNSLKDPYERVALEIAHTYEATAVYFRRFPNKSRPSIPQIYIYDDRDITRANGTRYS